LVSPLIEGASVFPSCDRGFPMTVVSLQSWGGHAPHRALFFSESRTPRSRGVFVLVRHQQQGEANFQSLTRREACVYKKNRPCVGGRRARLGPREKLGQWRLTEVLRHLRSKPVNSAPTPVLDLTILRGPQMPENIFLVQWLRRPSDSTTCERHGPGQFLSRRTPGPSVNTLRGIPWFPLVAGSTRTGNIKIFEAAEQAIQANHEWRRNEIEAPLECNFFPGCASIAPETKAGRWACGPPFSLLDLFNRFSALIAALI